MTWLTMCTRSPISHSCMHVPVPLNSCFWRSILCKRNHYAVNGIRKLFYVDVKLPFRSATSLSRANSLSDPMIPTVPPYVKSGVFRTIVESRTPISFLNVTGDTWCVYNPAPDTITNNLLKESKYVPISFFLIGSVRNILHVSIQTNSNSFPFHWALKAWFKWLNNSFFKTQFYLLMNLL